MCVRGAANRPAYAPLPDGLILWGSVAVDGEGSEAAGERRRPRTVFERELLLGTPFFFTCLGEALWAGDFVAC